MSFPDAEHQLKMASLRVTRPRLAVLSAVFENPHADTETIIAAARTGIPGLSHQAVYDSLATLTELGLLRKIKPAGSLARYESRTQDNHHHVVCRGCGRIEDVDCAIDEAPCLTPSQDHGFAIDSADVIYWGRCPECAPSTSTASPHSTNSFATPSTTPSTTRTGTP